MGKIFKIVCQYLAVHGLVYAFFLAAGWSKVGTAQPGAMRSYWDVFALLTNAMIKIIAFEIFIAIIIVSICIMVFVWTAVMAKFS